MRKRRATGAHGFTLIELLVVITILGILAAVVVFAVRGVGDKGQAAATAADAQTLRTAEEAYCAKFGHYAPDVATLVGAGLAASSGSINSIETTVPGACGNGSGGPSGFTVVCTVTTTNNCQGAPAAGAVTRGGTLVLASGTLTGPYNPAITSSGNSHPLGEAMFNGLLAFDNAGNIVPDLASALPAVQNNADGSQDVTVTLRPGMVWQDSTAGTPQPITNADVVFSYTQALLRAGRTGSSMSPALAFSGGTFTSPCPATPPATCGAITTFNVGGQPLGVDFHFLYPYSPLFRQMNVTEAPIIPQHVYQACATAGTLLNTTFPAPCAQNNAPVGSGPFMWVAANNPTNGFLTLTKNPQYFKTGLPYLAKIVLQNTGNAANALAASRSTAGSVDTGGVGATALTTPFNFTTSSSYSVASVPRGSGGSSCINTISFNLWQPAVTGANTAPLPEFGASDPGIAGGLPGTSPGESQANIVALPANAPYDNPILSSNLVRKAMFEGFNRGQAAISDTGVSSAVGAPVKTARMADSIYDSNLTGAYAPTTFPGGAGGTPDTAAANTDLNAAGWDGGLVTDSNGVSVRTWGNHPTFPQQATLGLVPGTQLKLDISHFTASSAPVIATQFVSDMKVIGIDVMDRNNLGSPAWPAVEAARNFEIGIVSYCNGDDPVIGVQRQYVSSAIPVTFAANTTGYRDQGTSPGDNSMDGLWYQANRAITTAQRTSIYAQIQTLAVSTNTQIPVDESVTNRVTRSVCQGLNNQNTGLFVESAYCSG